MEGGMWVYRYGTVVSNLRGLLSSTSSPQLRGDNQDFFARKKGVRLGHGKKGGRKEGAQFPSSVRFQSEVSWVGVVCE